MANGSGILDNASLLELRRLVRLLNSHRASGRPVQDLIRLAAEVRDRTGLTIDFDASADLGQPMVVLRVPEHTPMLPGFENLTPREREVAALVARGLTNRDIAAALTISLATAKDHVHRVITKTGVSGRSGVIAAYLSQG